MNTSDLRKSSAFIIVDDDPLCTWLHKQVIEHVVDQPSVQVFHCCREALDYFARNSRPVKTVLLLDLNMPIMNGWEFIEEFTQLHKEQRKHTHIVILSSSIDARDMEKAGANSHVSQFISKPLTVENFSRLLERINYRG